MAELVAVLPSPPDEPSPVQPGWELLSQGAEARVYGCTVFGLPAVAKHRFKKTYRHPEIDAKLRKERTLAEARCLAKCAELGIRAPAVLVADTARHALYLERVAGLTGKAYVDEHRWKRPERVADMLRRFGEAVAVLHDAGLTHGDLTTSNVICEAAADGELESLALIDFGLGSLSSTPEDKAVDLYVLERALISTHRDADEMWDAVRDAYRAKSADPGPTLTRLDAVRARGRKRECFG